MRNVVITPKELVDLGMPPNIVDHRLRAAVKAGRAKRLARGVYETDYPNLKQILKGYESIYNLLDKTDENGTPVRLPDYSTIGRLVKSVISKSHRVHHLTEGVMQAIAALMLDAVESDHYNQRVLERLKTPTKPKGSVEAFINFSDWHIGKQFKHVSNVYNYDVFKERIDYILNQIITELDMYKDRLGTIYINAIGDMVDGQEIFSTQPWEEEFHVGQQIYKTTTHLLDIITLLKDRYSVPIKFYGITGNHGLISKTANPRANFDAIVYSILGLLLDQTETEWEIFNDPDRLGYYNIMDGRVVVLAHGHFSMRHRSAVSRTEAIGKLLSEAVDANVALVLMGHIHRSIHVNVEDTSIITTGSIVGYDLYAASKLLPRCKPQQSMVILEGNSIKHIILEIPIKSKLPGKAPKRRSKVG